MFGDPFDSQLLAIVKPLVEKAVADNQITDVKVHSGKTVVCMEGPQFSTRAESKLYRSWGGDIIKSVLTYRYNCIANGSDAA